MKNEAISKINKFGRIGNGIALVGKILVGICIAFLLVAAVIGFVLPKDFINVALSTNVEMDINTDSLGMDFTEDEMAEFQADFVAEAEEDKADYVVTNIEVAGYNISIDEKTEDVNLSVRSLAWLMILLTAGLAMIMVVLCFASSLCKAFSDCSADTAVTTDNNYSFTLIVK